MFLIGIYHGTRATEQTPLNIYKAETKIITKLIKQNEIEKALFYINEASKKYPLSMTLALSSNAGKQIYQKEGVRGLLHCIKNDTPSTFGCVRSILLTENSSHLEAHREIHDICTNSIIDQEKSGMCLHISGHALLGSKGYKKTDVIHARNECQKIIPTSPKEESACTFGVLMEYFVARLGPNGLGLQNNLTKIPPQGYSENNPYDICTGELENEACFSMIPSWWILTIKLTPEKAIQHCLQIPSNDLIQTCLSSLTRKLFEITRKEQGATPATLDDFLKICLLYPAEHRQHTCTEFMASLLLNEY